MAITAQNHILILDDDGFRHNYFIKQYADRYSLINCVCFAEFFSAVRNVQPTAIFLDHDLGERKNGVDAALLLIETSLRRDTKIIIHSRNPVGAKRMFDILKRGGFTEVYRIPFRTE